MRVVMLTNNDWHGDSRVIREAEALARHGLEVEVVFRRPQSEISVEQRNGVRYLGVPSGSLSERGAPGLLRFHLLVLRVDAARLLTGPDRLSAIASLLHLALLPLLALMALPFLAIAALLGWQRRGFVGLRYIWPRFIFPRLRELIGAHLVAPVLQKVADFTSPLLQLKTYGLQPLLYLNEYAFSCAHVVRQRAPDVVHAHDLITLSCALAVCHRVKAREFIYDAHELETHTNYWSLNGWTNHWVRRYESALIRRANGVVTVCDSIAEWLADAYRIRRPTVVHNVPTDLVEGAANRGSNSRPTLRTVLRLPSRVPLVVYVGSVTIDRGLKHCVTALKFLPGVHFALVGPRYSVTEQEILQTARNVRADDRVHLVDAVGSDEVVDFIQDADCSVIAVQNVCLSYYFCLPNKLFESVMAGIPVAAARLIELERFVEQTGVGLVMDETDPQDIARAVSEIIANRDQYRPTQQKLIEISRRYGWDVQEKRLLNLYQELAPGQCVG